MGITYRRYKKLSLTIASHYEKRTNIRNNELRHIVKDLAQNSDTLTLEDLKTKNLTKSGKGTVENLWESKTKDWIKSKSFG